jgi:ElaB/YqjD/DUF883 family membrane-anchored ribosome-binding protein
MYQMNDQKLENKIRQDILNIKKDLRTLAGHGTTRVNRIEGDISDFTGNARAGLSTWVEENVSQMSKDFERLTGNAMDTVASAAATVKKEVGHGLNQYNAKAQEYADKIPGGLAEKAARYPWVAISIGLGFGLILGGLLKPARR